MSNKTFLLLEVVENTIEKMTTYSSFEDILNDALAYADQYVEEQYSEGEIDKWNDEMSSFRNSRPDIPYEYQNNSGELGFSYDPADNEFNFWSREKDVVDIYIKNIKNIKVK